MSIAPREIPAHEESYAATIAAFTLRARRIEQHSIFSDKSKVVAWAHVQLRIRTAANGGRELVHDLPGEELFESAAARVRPIMLESDPVAYTRVLPALKYFLRDAGKDLLAELASLREDWYRLVPLGGTHRAYSLVVSGPGIPEGLPAVTDSDLAMGWFYGDVVHADASRKAATDVYGIRERYRAAVGLVSGALYLTVATLNLIRRLNDDGLLSVPESVWEEEVTVGDPLYRYALEAAHVAEAGTPLPQHPGEALNGGITPVGDDPGPLAARMRRPQPRFDR